MSKIKYYYDTETCKYERIKVTKWDIFLNLMGFLTVSIIVAIAIFFIYHLNFDSPKEALLKKENEELEFYYDMMSKEMDKMDDMMQALQMRDDNVYRTIFEAEPIPASVRTAGVGGANRYRDVIDQNVERENLILENMERIESIKKRMYIQTKSYDEILDLALKKSEMLASIPAIQPISNKELTRLASGFGYRIHPIYKVRKMHTGIDFSAPTGTPIYATGNGKVIKRTASLRGYGHEIEIDHGYGFVTKYAHMVRFNVQLGQQVKRGECIGFVGSTGTSVAPHLHYEIIKDGQKINPINYMFEDITESEYETLIELASQENQSLGGQ